MLDFPPPPAMQVHKPRCLWCPEHVAPRPSALSADLRHVHRHAKIIQLDAYIVLPGPLIWRTLRPWDHAIKNGLHELSRWYHCAFNNGFPIKPATHEVCSMQFIHLTSESALGIEFRYRQLAILGPIAHGPKAFLERENDIASRELFVADGHDVIGPVLVVSSSTRPLNALDCLLGKESRIHIFRCILVRRIGECLIFCAVRSPVITHGPPLACRCRFFAPISRQWKRRTLGQSRRLCTPCPFPPLQSGSCRCRETDQALRHLSW